MKNLGRETNMSGWGKASILRDKLPNISGMLKIYYQIHWCKDGKVERDVLVKFLKEKIFMKQKEVSSLRFQLCTASQPRWVVFRGF